MLGLGRAIGETIAVTLVIGNAPQIGKHDLLDQGYTLAAVIANEFGEAASTTRHRAALIAAGLVLFVLTLVVNVDRPLRTSTARRAQAAERHAAVAEGDGADEHASPGSLRPISARRRRDATSVMRARRCSSARLSRSCRSCSSLLPAQARASAPGASTSSRPTRPARFLGDPGGIKTRASLGTIEIVALATRDRDPDRHRRRALPRRVRQGRPLRATSSATSST